MELGLGRDGFELEPRLGLGPGLEQIFKMLTNDFQSLSLHIVFSLSLAFSLLHSLHFTRSLSSFFSSHTHTLSLSLFLQVSN